MFTMPTLSKHELDCADNIVKQSNHVHLQFLPNHHIDLTGQLRGFVTTSHSDDSASTLPINKAMFATTSVYACTTEQDTVFNNDALKIVNNLPVYKASMQQLLEDLQSSDLETAQFDCISDVNNTQVAIDLRRGEDTRPWVESMPDKIGVYHTFMQSNATDCREHKLFIVVQSKLTTAAEELHNLWLDVKDTITCKQFLGCEECTWLRSTTQRNNNRLASRLAKCLGLTCRHVADNDDPTGRSTLVYPLLSTVSNDLQMKPNSQHVQYVDAGCFADPCYNGILFDMCVYDGFWIFKGQPDFAEHHIFGGHISSPDNVTGFPCTTVQYHDAFPATNISSVVHLHVDNRAEHILGPKKNYNIEYFFPDECFLKKAEMLGFGRNDGVLTLMPLLCYSA